MDKNFNRRAGSINMSAVAASPKKSKFTRIKEKLGLTSKQRQYNLDEMKDEIAYNIYAASNKDVINRSAGADKLPSFLAVSEATKAYETI